MRPALALCLTLAAAPATAPAAADRAALVAEGARIYAEICHDCHGPTATEGEAGDIRGLPVSVIQNATQAGIEMMPVIDLTPDEIAAVAAYLAELARD